MASSRKPTPAILAARARSIEVHDLNHRITAEALRSLTFGSLRNVNFTRCERWHGPGSDPWTLADWSNALCGEAGELANVIKKIRRQQTGCRNDGDPTMRELCAAAAAELADVVIYADLLASQLGVDLGDAVVDKFNKVSEKFGFPERLKVRS